MSEKDSQAADCENPGREGTDVVVWSLCVAGIIGFVFSLLNQWFLLGITTWLLMILIAALGYGEESRRRAILATLIGLFLSYCLVFGGIVWTEDPNGEIVLLFGLPMGTALLMYGIWPLGAVIAILYLLVFDRSVLPDKKLREFRSAFGRPKDTQ